MTKIEMVEEERLFYRVYCKDLDPPLILQKCNSSGKIRMYISTEHQKPNYGNAEVVFSEDKKKLAFYPRRSKKIKMFTTEYIYITIHSLSESVTNLLVYFKMLGTMEEAQKGVMKIQFPIYRDKTARIKKAHKDFLDDLMAHPKKRKEFMQTIQDLKEDRVNRLRNSTSASGYRNQCKC